MQPASSSLATLIDGIAVFAMALISAAVVACAILASLGAFTS